MDQEKEGMISIAHFAIENLDASENDKLSIGKSEVGECHVAVVEWGVDPSGNPGREESVGVRGVRVSEEPEDDADV